MENFNSIKIRAVMLDTSIFNKLLDNSELINKLPSNFKYYATNVQIAEIHKNTDLNRKKQLLALFNEIIDEKVKSVDTQWFVFNHSNFSNTRFISNPEKCDLDALSKNNIKHIEDAIILLTSKYGFSDMVVVTNENLKKCSPFKRAKKLGYQVLNLDEFMKLKNE